MNEDIEIAYLVGAIMGDGSYIPEKNSRIRFYFSSSDKEFIDNINEIIKKSFGFDLNIGIKRLSKKNSNWRDHYFISSRTLYNKLCKYLPDKTQIPKFIENGDVKIKSSFISGFFDAEGGVSLSIIKSRNALDRRIHCSCSDKKILESIKDYLSQIGIKSFIQNGHRAFVLNIWGFDGLTAFRDYVGFRIFRKNDKLNKSIGSYKYRKIMWGKEIKNKAENIRKDYGHSAIKIQKLLYEDTGLEVPKVTIEKWIYGGHEK